MSIPDKLLDLEVELVGERFEAQKGEALLDALRAALKMPDAAPEDIVEAAKDNRIAAKDLYGTLRELRNGAMVVLEREGWDAGYNLLFAAEIKVADEMLAQYAALKGDEA